jgi:hypothetical protein
MIYLVGHGHSEKIPLLATEKRAKNGVRNHSWYMCTLQGEFPE